MLITAAPTVTDRAAPAIYPGGHRRRILGPFPCPKPFVVQTLHFRANRGYRMELERL
jgi:hypothetical protein